MGARELRHCGHEKMIALHTHSLFKKVHVCCVHLGNDYWLQR